MTNEYQSLAAQLRSGSDDVRLEAAEAILKQRSENTSLDSQVAVLTARCQQQDAKIAELNVQIGVLSSQLIISGVEKTALQTKIEKLGKIIQSFDPRIVI